MRVIGHTEQLKVLKSALARNRLSHTLLFSGPEAVGKRVVALNLAEQILNPDRSEELQKKFWRGEHPDLHVLSVEEDKKDISVDQAREFITSIQLKPYLGSRRVAIIDDAHLLSISASNSLLLTLEEPPANCFIILVSHSPQRLLPTILSRSQELNFFSLNKSEVTEILSSIGISGELSSKLGEFSEHSLELLRLNEFRGNSYLVSVTPAVEKKINGIYISLNSLLSDIDSALRSQNGAKLLSLAAQLGDKENSSHLIFKLLLSRVREVALHQSKDIKSAEALTELIQLERATQSRNFNSVIQLSDYLMRHFS